MNSSQTTTLPPQRVVITYRANFQLASIFSSGGLVEVSREPHEGKKLVQSNKAKLEQSQESHLPNGDEDELRDAHQHDMLISSLYKQYQRHLIKKPWEGLLKPFISCTNHGTNIIKPRTCISTIKEEFRNVDCTLVSFF